MYNIIPEKASAGEVEEVLAQREGVGVMKDRELNLEEVEVSHTLGGSGEGGDQGLGIKEERVEKM